MRSVISHSLTLPPILGSTIFWRKYFFTSVANGSPYLCTGRYNLFNYTIGACSNGGIKYQTVASTITSFPSLAPSAIPPTSPIALPTATTAKPSLAPSAPSVVPPHSPTTSPEYFIMARYSDAACTSVVYAKALLLHSCDKESGGNYVMHMATSSTFSTTYYSDSACKTVAYTSLVYYKSSCTDSSLSFVSPDGVPTSVTDVVSRRLESVVFLSYTVHHFSALT